MDKNTKKLIKELQKMPYKIQTKTLKKSFKKSANLLKKEVKSRVPIETGTLRKSISVKTVPKSKIGPNRLVFKVGYGTKGWYGMFFDFGTEYRAPIPILVPALESIEPQTLSLVKSSLKIELDKLNSKEK